MGTKQKLPYDHLIPQTYMKAWKHGNSSVYIVDKGMSGLGESKSTKRFGGIGHYHSVRAGSLLRSEEDCKVFFKPLENHTVILEEKVLDSNTELNNKFHKFDEWKIINSEGNVLIEQEKRIVKEEIRSIHLRDIESEWGRQYENNWNSINELISNEVFNYHDANSIEAIKRDELIKFIISLEWRTKPFHPLFQTTLDKLCSERVFDFDLKACFIPEDKRLYPFLETEYDELAHSLILSQFSQFLDGNGVIMDEAMIHIKNSCITLMLAPSDGEFLTSDNPVLRFKDSAGYINYFFPLNPKVGCHIKKGSIKDKYFLRRLSKKGINEFNIRLKRNCYKSYILRQQELSLYFSL